MPHLIPQRSVPDLLTRLHLDLAAAERRLRRLLPSASHEHLDRVLDRIRTGTEGDHRGALFELKTLDEMREEVLRELVIEYAPPCLQGKCVDFFIPSAGLGIEATASNRDAIPASEFVGGDDDETMRMRISAAGCGDSNYG